MPNRTEGGAKRIAVVLSGCGFQDGSEIQEAVCCLLAIDRAGAKAVCFAPATAQAQVMNHISGNAVKGEERSMLVESARIARGAISDLKLLRTEDVDGVIFPGGFGAALNLCDFAHRGAECEVHPGVLRVVRDMHAAGKPMGFICIAPVIAARVLGHHGVSLTIGTDPATAQNIEKMGAKHIPRGAREVCIDATHKVVSTPAYMLAQGPADVEGGVTALVKEVLSMVPLKAQSRVSSAVPG